MNAVLAGDAGRTRGDEFTAQVCLDHAKAQRKKPFEAFAVIASALI
ncbi:hypothetical protein [Catellatospora chokoriensis]|nr:hypothetical protein [Catellatospora chokoriensis]